MIQQVKRLLVRVSIWAVVFVVLLNGWLYLQQPKMTFYPAAKLLETPDRWGLPYEEVQLLTEDKVRLHGWYIPQPTATRTLLFFHGNGGNISHRGESLAIFNRLGLNVLIIDYRGYGHSEGQPDEQGLYRDATAAWHYLTGQRGLSAKQIIIFGRSLGGAVAAQLASRVEPGALILESTFSSARDMAGQLFPLLSHVILLRYSFDSEQQIRQLKSPLFMAHSPQDEIIPYSQGIKLYAAAPPSKRFFEMRGGHNDGFLQSQPGYEQSLRRFIRELDVGAIK
jgi:fermentation-respiration switch protein FrsA (DUF1100 family)